MKVTVSRFSAKDFEQAKKFYGAVLGLKKRSSSRAGRSLPEARGKLPSESPRIRERAANPVPPSLLQVEDIEAERKRLEARGVKFEGKAEEIPGVVKLSTFRDPSSNRLQLAQSLMPRS